MSEIRILNVTSRGVNIDDDGVSSSRDSGLWIVPLKKFSAPQKKTVMRMFKKNLSTDDFKTGAVKSMIRSKYRFDKTGQ